MPQSHPASVSARRILVALAPPVLAAAAVLATFLSVRDRLPGRMAVHIGAGGGADGFSGQGAFLATALGVLIGTGALFGALAYWIRTTPGVQRVLAVIGGTVAVPTGWLVVAVLLANTDVDDASSVTLPGTQAAFAFGAAALYAALGWLICGRAEEVETVSGPTADAERLTLADSEIAGWTRVAGSRVLPVTGVLVAASRHRHRFHHRVGARAAAPDHGRSHGPADGRPCHRRPARHHRHALPHSLAPTQRAAAEDRRGSATAPSTRCATSAAGATGPVPGPAASCCVPAMPSPPG
ncbi:hypothetical protein GCM10020000_03050 [Streptomyces olivoverticillatus]